jgi:hypothetical protein
VFVKSIVYVYFKKNSFPILLNLFFVAFLSFVVGYYLYSLAHILISPSQKKTTLISILGVTNIQQRMLSGCFEGYILSRYWLYDVVRSGYKFIHCDVINKGGFFNITIIVRATFVTTSKYKIFNPIF